MENVLFMGTEYQLNFLMNYSHLITGLEDAKIRLCSTKKEVNDHDFYLSDYFSGRSFESLIRKYSSGELEVPSRVFYTGDLRVHDSTWDLSTYVDNQVYKRFTELGVPEANLIKINLDFRRAKDREKHIEEYARMCADLDRLRLSFER